jgi:hypothetical protein
VAGVGEVQRLRAAVGGIVAALARPASTSCSMERTMDADSMPRDSATTPGRTPPPRRPIEISGQASACERPTWATARSAAAPYARCNYLLYGFLPIRAEVKTLPPAFRPKARKKEEGERKV